MASAQTRNEQNPSTASIAACRATKGILALRHTAVKHAAKENTESKLANAHQKRASYAQRPNLIQPPDKRASTAANRARAGHTLPWARLSASVYVHAGKSTSEGESAEIAPQANSVETISMQSAKYAMTDTFRPPPCPRFAIAVLLGKNQMLNALHARHARATHSALAAPCLAPSANRVSDRPPSLTNVCPATQATTLRMMDTCAYHAYQGQSGRIRLKAALRAKQVLYRAKEALTARNAKAVIMPMKTQQSVCRAYEGQSDRIHPKRARRAKLVMCQRKEAPTARNAEAANMPIMTHPSVWSAHLDSFARRDLQSQKDVNLDLFLFLGAPCAPNARAGHTLLQMQLLASRALQVHTALKDLRTTRNAPMHPFSARLDQRCQRLQKLAFTQTRIEQTRFRAIEATIASMESSLSAQQTRTVTARSCRRARAMAVAMLPSLL